MENVFISHGTPTRKSPKIDDKAIRMMFSYYNALHYKWQDKQSDNPLLDLLNRSIPYKDKENVCENTFLLVLTIIQEVNPAKDDILHITFFDDPYSPEKSEDYVYFVYANGSLYSAVFKTEMNSEDLHERAFCYCSEIFCFDQESVDRFSLSAKILLQGQEIFLLQEELKQANKKWEQSKAQIATFEPKKVIKKLWNTQ